MRVLNIFCVTVVLIMSAVMVIPLLLLVGEYFSGSKHDSLIYQMLTHEHEHYQRKSN